MPIRSDYLRLSCGFVTCIVAVSGCSPDTGTGTAAVTVTVAGGGSVSSLPAGINCGTDCSEDVVVGTQLTLTAIPDANYTFSGWSGGGCTGSGTCTLTVNANTAVTATFLVDQMLTVVPSGTGTGRVIASPGGIDCGADCSELYLPETVVTLSAMADASSTFTGWSGAGCSGTGTCVVTMDEAREVTATFVLMRHELAVVRNGTGSGSVQSVPPGIDCNADCEQQYDHGTVVRLTATADVGSTFVGWSGGSCTGTGDCDVTLLAATQVTANFSVNQEGLNVMKTGNGSGTVTSSPAGINCGADCQEFYAHGTMVTLTATPAVGSVFSGWSGSGCAGTGTCTVTITASTTVTATFTLTTHSLSASKNGTGVGSVSSSPAGISCGADCTEVYDYGTSVTLMAAPAVGTTFTGWSGAGCSGSGICTVTVTQAESVTATFTLNSHSLSVAKAGTGTGTVTSSPAGVNCGADCTEAYNHGTLVTLTAIPGGASSFAGWSGGGCSGTGTCAVTLLAATTVTATFSTCSGSATLAYTGAMQTFTVPACASSITVDAYGAQGGASTGENGGLNFSGGLGARVRGTFAVSGGQVLNVLVGGQGATNNCGGAGGGGSFVLRSSTMPATTADIMLIAAGGGGAMHCNYYGGTNGGGGQSATNGGSGVASTGGNPPPACVAGGTNGAGGTLNGWGGGGGGFLTNGLSAYDPAGGGNSFLTGAAGGNIGGGFGGGGGRYQSCCGGGGGGGGYSGGGGGSADGCSGGGGGSLNNGSSQTNSAAVRSGAGTVIITY